MPSRVYSTRFFLGAADGSSIQDYVVPSGYVAIVTDVQAALAAGAGDFGYFDANGTVVWEDGGTAAGGSLNNIHWTGRMVFNAGELFAFAATSSAFVICSGYLLTAD
jgi:hypothetical protein